MAGLAGAVRRAPRRDRDALAISDSDLADRAGLREALGHAGLRLVVAGALPLEKALESAGPGAAVLVLLTAGTLQGVRLKEFVDDRVRVLRGLAPQIGVLVLVERACNTSLLPPRTWLAAGQERNLDLRPMVEAVGANIVEQVETLRRWPSARPVPSLRSLPRPGRPPHCVPNFNVRHPAMLVPIARVAASLRTPVFCEISPQEALTFHRGGQEGHDPNAAVRAVLGRLRENVDHVRAATGCEMWLHLDHCDDPELISFALEVGFDSIMADACERPLGLNVAFTRAVVRRAQSRGVPVEGEVGSIDPAGRRRTSRTELADAVRYVRETGISYLGINAGQVHGSDYGYNRARRAIREIGDLDLMRRGGDACALYEACRELDAELAERGVARAHADRRRLHALRERLVSDPCISAEDELLAAYRSADVVSWTLLARLEEDWHRRRAALVGRKRRLCDAVADPEVAGWSEKPSTQRYLDLHLLQEVAGSIAEMGARVVLHGGSSIYFDDLRLLDRLGVARVNLGSGPFAAFLAALAARSPDGGPSARPTKLPDVLRFLEENAGDWRDWLDGGGTPLEGFEEHLRQRYFLPLSGTSGDALRVSVAAV